MSMITCPNCEQDNPNDRYYCDHCGFRLVAPEPPPEEPEKEEEPPDTSSLNPFSLPTRQPGETGDLDLDNIPDWLRTGEHKIPEGANQTTSDSDWLSDLEDITFNVGQGDSDDWLDAPVPDIDGPIEDPTPSGVEELQQWQDGPDDLESGALPNWLADSDSPESEPITTLDDEASLTNWLHEDEEAVAPSVASDLADTEMEGLTSFLDSSSINDPETANDGSTSSEDKVDLGGLTGFLAELDNVTTTESSEADDSPLNLIDPTPAAAELEAYRRGTDELGTAADQPVGELEQPESEIDEVADLVAELDGDWEQSPSEPTLSEAELESFNLFEDDNDVADELAESLEISAVDEPEVSETIEEVTESPTLTEEETASEPEADKIFDLEADFPPDFIDNAATSLDELGEADPKEEVDLTGFTNWLEEIQDLVQDPAVNEEIDQADLITDPNLDIPADDDETMVSEFLEELGLDTSPANELDDDVDDDVPDWLAEIQPDDTGILPSSSMDEAESIAPTADAVPDWLSDIAPDNTQESTATFELDDDWLSDVVPEGELLSGDGPEAAQTIEDADDSLSALEEEIIASAESGSAADWLDEIIDAGEQEEPAGPSITDYPDTIVVSPPSKPDTGQLEGIPEELAGADLPDWLAGARISDDAESRTQPEPTSATVGDDFLNQGDISYTDMPDWLQSDESGFDSALDAALAIQGSEMMSAMGGEWAEMLAELPNAAPDEPEEPLQLEEAEIPEWLQELKPDENAPADIAEPEEVTGVLAGVRGVIDVEPIIALPRQSEPMKLATADSAQEKQAELLRKVAISERAQAVQVGEQRARAIPLWLRLVLAAVLVGTLLATQLEVVQNLFDDLMTPPPVPAAATDLGDTLSGINGQTVLVAVDYTPANQGELEPIAELLLAQLAAQGNQFVFVTQYPAGVPLARQLSAELTSSELGYLPGEAVGLRQLASCLNGLDCTDFPELDSEVGLILLLTSERASLQNWVEQVSTTVDTPLVAGLSGMLAPLTAPYLQSEQVDGALIGTQAAASYATLQANNGELISQARGQSTAVWATVIIILLGNTISLFGRQRNPKPISDAIERADEDLEAEEAEL